MDTKAAVMALLSVWGVGTCTLPAVAQQSPAEGVVEEDATSEETSNPLLNRVWVRADDTGLPGPMQIFLADGTLVTDSCWETYRLSSWQQVSDTKISWDEDGMAIDADIETLSDTELVLRLHLVGDEIVEQRYVPATVPYLCPDMEK